MVLTVRQETFRDLLVDFFLMGQMISKAFLQQGEML